MGRSSRRAAPTGFTLIEMMVAVGLTVLMMTMVVTIFGLVMDSIRDSRAAIEVNDRLRAAKNRLQNDLMGLTAPLTPPLNPELGLGYFELIEGPMGPVYHPTEIMPYSVVSDIPDTTRYTGLGTDTTVGDLDDFLMFTVRSGDEPFVGNAVVATIDSMGNFAGLRYKPIQSRVAEVAWFVRGTTLHRRVLLVATPALLADERWPTAAEASNLTFFQHNDLSVHLEGDADLTAAPIDLSGYTVVPNTLGDLTKRENRYAHQPFAWPYDARFWGNLCLPTLEECSADPNYEIAPLDYYKLGLSKANLWPTSGTSTDPNGRKLFVPNTYASGTGVPFSEWISTAANYPLRRLKLSADPTYVTQHFDAWRYPHPSLEQDHSTGQFVKTGTRVGEDVILTDVLSCDVKVWDPGAPTITLNDPSESVNAEALSPTDPPIVYTDSGNRVSASAAAYAVNRIATDNGNSDLDQIIGFGAYVDLNYMCRLGPPSSATYKSKYDEVLATIKATAALQKVVSYDPNPPTAQFHHNGDPRSGLMGTFPTLKSPRVVDPPPDPPVASDFSDLELMPSVYDTYSTHYETDGINQTNVPWLTARANADTGADSLDTDNDGAVDEKTTFPDMTGENETAPPYPHPLRGIQIKIRVFEPGTRQVREVTLEHEFVSQ